MTGMTEEQARIRAEELRNIISENNRLYYVENSPKISDYDYDMLMNELIAIEKRFPVLATPDSPTMKVGSDLATGHDTRAGIKEFRQFQHRYPMLSLGNTYDISEVEEFVSRASRLAGRDFTFSCELKFDGTAICLTYRGGKLFRALTRGDGTIGDDVTVNVRHIRNIPQELKGSGFPDEFEIRGEIYMPYEAFDRLNGERERNEDPPFANPRNAASGSLKLLDPKEVGHRGLECTLYHMLGENLPFSTHDEALRAASAWGLPVSDKRKVCRNIGEIEEYIGYWDKERKFLPFATDGIVIKVNELELQRQLGYTSKFPRWATAYKFKAEQALTQVLSIDYQVGRTGAVTPVANLEPVQLAGTSVKRATLHNSDQMQMLDIRVGDHVYVEKGGEIIPKITGVELSMRTGSEVRPVFPVRCPDCGAVLVRDEGEAKFFCPNTSGCPTQIKGKLVHFVSRKAMNVLAGDATIEQLYNLGLVRTPADFYSLTREDLLRLDGWKERSAARFLESLAASREVSFEHVLYALGIRYVGESTAKELAGHFKDIDSLMSASREDLLQAEDIGEVIADSVTSFFADPGNREQVERLRKAGLRFSIQGNAGQVTDIFKGMTMVVSGVFSVPRDKIKKLITDNGGKCSSSISGKTAFLIAGEKPGPEKVQKATASGVRIISEEDFMQMLPQEGTAEAPDHMPADSDGQMLLFGQEEIRQE